ncbi:MAG TPA: hypothetical protein VLC49_06560, partial [Solirubrobacteraceae bacterium]|nr:hypothetical protein [Solirubrobacteraceae bacterium]
GVAPLITQAVGLLSLRLLTPPLEELSELECGVLISAVMSPQERIRRTAQVTLLGQQDAELKCRPGVPEPIRPAERIHRRNQIPCPCEDLREPEHAAPGLWILRSGFTGAGFRRDSVRRHFVLRGVLR